MSDKVMQPAAHTLIKSKNLQNILHCSVIQKLRTRVRHLITQRSYEILVGSFLVLIFGDTFSRAVTMAVLLPLQNMCIALVVFFKSAILRKVVASLIVSVLLIIFVNCYFHSKQLVGTICVIYFIYFSIISFKVYKKIFNTESVSTEMMAAVICGFILLCLTGAIIFIAIEVKYPHSFANVALGVERFQNLLYFSFSTLLTIGYGDIVPLSLLAKRSVMLIALTGHVYTVFLTGIIIGKYIQLKT